MKAKKQIVTLRVSKLTEENYNILIQKTTMVEKNSWIINVTQIFQEWFGREIKLAFLSYDPSYNKDEVEYLAEKLKTDYNKNCNLYFDDDVLVIMLKNGKVFILTSSEWGYIKQIKGDN